MSLGLTGCANFPTDYNDTVKEVRMDDWGNCSIIIGSIAVCNVPCDKYKIGDNPFKCDTL